MNNFSRIITQHKLLDAWQDIIKGTTNWRLWTHMGTSEIRRRYRRTLIGPFWTTLSLAVYIPCMGFLFSFLFKTDIHTFLPYFASGYICWMLFSTIVVESCSVFIAADGLIKQMSIPYSTFSWLVIFRNILVLGHHAVFYGLLILIMRIPINSSIILLIPGLLLIAVAGFCTSLIIGVVCTRYRDLQQVINLLLQISVFMTPVFWVPTQVDGLRSELLVKFNPLHHYINIIRAPLLGNFPELTSWMIASSITLFLAIVAFWIFAIYQRKIVYWL